MKEKITQYIKNWSFMWLARLVLGVVILLQGFVAGDTLSMLLGGSFAGMAMVNIGCNGACAINSTQTSGKPDEDKLKEATVRK